MRIHALLPGTGTISPKSLHVQNFQLTSKIMFDAFKYLINKIHVLQIQDWGSGQGKKGKILLLNF